MTKETSYARASLIKLLQEAYSGELAAALAYKGHAIAVTDDVERVEILKICGEELHHRIRLAEMLKGLGSDIDTELEHKMKVIGKIIGNLCSWTRWVPGSWFFSMYGAGRLESHNIGEYKEAAMLAWVSGQEDLVEELLRFAEVEWDHEEYFHGKVKSHILSRIIPLWQRPGARGNIRSSFERFTRSWQAVLSK